MRNTVIAGTLATLLTACAAPEQKKQIVDPIASFEAAKPDYSDICGHEIAGYIPETSLIAVADCPTHGEKVVGATRRIGDKVILSVLGGEFDRQQKQPVSKSYVPIVLYEPGLFGIFYDRRGVIGYSRAPWDGWTQIDMNELEK